MAALLYLATKENAMKKLSPAEQNAESHADTILELYRAYCALQDGAETVTVEGHECTNTDCIGDRVRKAVIDVCIRCHLWEPVGEEIRCRPDEFRILLETGVTALQITGELDGHLAPENARLQVHDWDSPWTDYTPTTEETEDWEEALMWFAGCFYFGDREETD